MKTSDIMKNGLKKFQNHLQLLTETYNSLIQFANGMANAERVVHIKKKKMLERALALFGPQICSSKNQLPLHEMFELAIHLKTGAVIVATRVCDLPSKSLQFSQPFLTQFQTFAVYMPGLGVEIATVGRVGEICNHPFVLRSESACTPSFLFGSQQCNCASQWRCTQELAAYFNSDQVGKSETIGFLMIHLENQNGMGMGYTPDTFALDLGTRAHLRHAAGLATSQKHTLSIEESFKALGLSNDPRRAADGAGYKITPILLDFMATHTKPILLSNNPMKIQGLKNFGYAPLRLKLVGEVTSFGQAETKQRTQTFNYLDMNSELTSFDSEYKRLKEQIQTTYQAWGTYVN